MKIQTRKTMSARLFAGPTLRRLQSKRFDIAAEIARRLNVNLRAKDTIPKSL